MLAWLVDGITSLGKGRLAEHSFHHRLFLSFSKEQSNMHAYRSIETDLAVKKSIKAR
jgi:hypothetical protein